MIVKLTRIGTVLITSDPDPETGQADDMIEVYPDELRALIAQLTELADSTPDV